MVHCFGEHSCTFSISHAKITKHNGCLGRKITAVCTNPGWVTQGDWCTPLSQPAPFARVMATFQTILQLVGEQIAAWVDAPGWHVWREIAPAALKHQLQQTLARCHQILQINQMGYILFKEQDPTSPGEIFTITTDTLRLMRDTIHRLPFLQQ